MNDKHALRKTSVLILLAVLLIVACDIFNTESQLPPDDQTAITIKQGIAGKVWFWEGDFMPGDPPTGTITPVKRDVLVHMPTHIDSVEQPGFSPFYTSISTSLVAETSSNDSGFFQIHLEPGQYSIFVLEDTLFYANGFNGQGIIYPVSVYNDSVTQIDFDITYASTW